MWGNSRSINLRCVARGGDRTRFPIPASETMPPSRTDWLNLFENVTINSRVNWGESIKNDPNPLRTCGCIRIQAIRAPLLRSSDLPESTQNWPMIGGEAGTRAHTSTHNMRTRDAQLIGRVTLLRPRAPMLARGAGRCPPTPQRYSVAIPCQTAHICGTGMYCAICIRSEGRVS